MGNAYESRIARIKRYAGLQKKKKIGKHLEMVGSSQNSARQSDRGSLHRLETAMLDITVVGLLPWRQKAAQHSCQTYTLTAQTEGGLREFCQDATCQLIGRSGDRFNERTLAIDSLPDATPRDGKVPPLTLLLPPA